MLVIRQCNRTVKGTTVVSHFAELIFLMKTCNSFIVSFSNSVIVLIKL